MEIASAVFTLTVAIIRFVAEQDSNYTIVKQLGSTVQQIQDNITPLLSNPQILSRNQVLIHNLQALSVALNDTKFHLHLWTETRSHRFFTCIYPWSEAEQLKNDNERLMNQYLMLMGAIQFANFYHGHNVISSAASSNWRGCAQPPSIVHYFSPSRAAAENVKRFWNHYVGSETTLAQGDALCNSISSYLGLILWPLQRMRLLLRLDHRKTGRISFQTLQDHVRNGTIRGMVEVYSADPSLPLLVWINDNAQRNSEKALEASKRGIMVVQLASTGSAEDWITVNREFLRKHDQPDKIRYISDYARRERNSDGKLIENFNAGEDITRFIRGEGLKAPILISTTSRAIRWTRYVENYPNTGSVGGSYEMFDRYVAALGAGRKVDKAWMKFNA